LKEFVNPSEALGKLRTSTARLELLKALHKRGSIKASEMLLAELSESRNYVDLAKAANVAIQMGAKTEAIRLLIVAAKKAHEEAIRSGHWSGNATNYIDRLKKLDLDAARNLFDNFLQEHLAKADDTWRYYNAANECEAWGDSVRALRYRKLALKELLAKPYLTDDGILTAIGIMKALGWKQKARKFAGDYLDEVLSDGRAWFALDARSIPLLSNLPDRARALAEISVEAGMGTEFLNDLLLSIQTKLKKKHSVRAEIAFAEYLAELLGESGLPVQVYYAAARLHESTRDFDTARDFYSRAGCLDTKTANRIAAKKLKHLVQQFSMKTLADHLSVLKSVESLALQGAADQGEESKIRRAGSMISMDAAFSLSSGGEMLEVLSTAESVTDEHLKTSLLRTAFEDLSSRGFYREAAMLAEKIGDVQQAKDLWTKASLQFETDAAALGNRPRMLSLAMSFAEMAGDSDRHDQLLTLFIESLSHLEEKRAKHVELCEIAADEMSSGFFRANRLLCMDVIECLKEIGSNATLARLLIRVGLQDEAVFEQALVQLEKNRNYSEAAAIAKAAGDRRSEMIYSYLQNQNAR
jgi:hypothetical protein